MNHIILTKGKWYSELNSIKALIARNNKTYVSGRE